MTTTIVTRKINAPIEKVFKTVADIGQFSEAIPHIVNIEFLSEIKSGLGTKFRETRLMKSKESSTELEVTEYVENERIRLVADSHGTVWDTTFTVTPGDDGTELNMTMEARSYKLVPKIMNPLIKGMVKKMIEIDMDYVKKFCEG